MRAKAIVAFPGGYGTFDELFEVLTLVQTGKTALVPLVLLDVPGGNYWKRWEALVREALLGRDLIGSEDLHLFYVTDSVEDALSEVLGFYRRYHSMRFVGEQLVIRLKKPLRDETLLAVEREWSDILGGAVKQAEGPLKGEGEEEPGLSRLVLPFDRQHYGRLRQLINFINQSG